jgi:hypothetical protein
LNDVIGMILILIILIGVFAGFFYFITSYSDLSSQLKTNYLAVSAETDRNFQFLAQNTTVKFINKGSTLEKVEGVLYYVFGHKCLILFSQTPNYTKYIIGTDGVLSRCCVILNSGEYICLYYPGGVIGVITNYGAYYYPYLPSISSYSFHNISGNLIKDVGACVRSILNELKIKNLSLCTEKLIISLTGSASLKGVYAYVWTANGSQDYLPLGSTLTISVIEGEQVRVALFPNFSLTSCEYNYINAYWSISGLSISSHYGECLVFTMPSNPVSIQINVNSSNVGVASLDITPKNTCENISKLNLTLVYCNGRHVGECVLTNITLNWPDNALQYNEYTLPPGEYYELCQEYINSSALFNDICGICNITSDLQKLYSCSKSQCISPCNAYNYVEYVLGNLTHISYHIVLHVFTLNSSYSGKVLVKNPAVFKFIKTIKVGENNLEICAFLPTYFYWLKVNDYPWGNSGGISIYPTHVTFACNNPNDYIYICPLKHKIFFIVPVTVCLGVTINGSGSVPLGYLGGLIMSYPIGKSGCYTDCIIGTVYFIINYVKICNYYYSYQAYYPEPGKIMGLLTYSSNSYTSCNVFLNNYTAIINCKHELYVTEIATSACSLPAVFRLHDINYSSDNIYGVFYNSTPVNLRNFVKLKIYACGSGLLAINYYNAILSFRQTLLINPGCIACVLVPQGCRVVVSAMSFVNCVKFKGWEIMVKNGSLCFVCNLKCRFAYNKSTCNITDICKYESSSCYGVLVFKPMGNSTIIAKFSQTKYFNVTVVNNAFCKYSLNSKGYILAKYDNYCGIIYTCSNLVVQANTIIYLSSIPTNGYLFSNYTGSITACKDYITPLLYTNLSPLYTKIISVNGTQIPITAVNITLYSLDLRNYQYCYPEISLVVKNNTGITFNYLPINYSEYLTLNVTGRVAFGNNLALHAKPYYRYLLAYYNDSTYAYVNGSDVSSIKLPEVPYFGLCICTSRCNCYNLKCIVVKTGGGSTEIISAPSSVIEEGNLAKINLIGIMTEQRYGVKVCTRTFIDVGAFYFNQTIPCISSVSKLIQYTIVSKLFIFYEMHLLNEYIKHNVIINSNNKNIVTFYNDTVFNAYINYAYNFTYTKLFNNSLVYGFYSAKLYIPREVNIMILSSLLAASYNGHVLCVNATPDPLSILLKVQFLQAGRATVGVYNSTIPIEGFVCKLCCSFSCRPCTITYEGLLLWDYNLPTMTVNGNNILLSMLFN